MTIKLFHVTEFAESAYLSPETQREVTHPVTVLSLTSLWLTVVCNIPLWRELSHLPLETGQLWWLGLRLGLIMVFALMALLSLLCWRRTLKPAALLLLLLSALNTPLMLGQAGAIELSAGLSTTAAQVRHAASWQLAGLFLALGLLPSLWLWRLPVRRIPLLANLRQNALLFVLCGAVVIGLWWLSAQDVLALLRQSSQLPQLLNPFSSFHTWAPSSLTELVPH